MLRIPMCLRVAHLSLLLGLTASYYLAISDGRAATSEKLLRGSVKEDASLRPSLRVLPAPDRTPPCAGATREDLFPLDADLVQYKGGVRYVGGKPAPLLNKMVPTSDSRISGVIPPISSYTLVPRNSLWVAPGYEVTSSTSQKTLTSTCASTERSTPAMNKGVTSWDSDYDVSRIDTSKHVPLASLPTTDRGVTSWLPEYAATRSVNVAQAPGSGGNAKNSARNNSVGTGSSPDHRVSLLTSFHGVVCWSPGYEVSVETPGLIKTSLGGLWYAPRELNTWPESLPGIKTFLEAVPGPPAMVATPLLLPELRANTINGSVDWGGWYKSIAKAIYYRWQCAEVGPGLATVRVTITKARDLSCQLVDFKPAEGMERNVVAETAFREAAVKAVKDLRTFEIPELPPLAGYDQVTFDVEMKRTVDGPIGVDIALVQPRTGGRKSNSSIQTARTTQTQNLELPR